MSKFLSFCLKWVKETEETMQTPQLQSCPLTEISITSGDHSSGRQRVGAGFVSVGKLSVDDWSWCINSRKTKSKTSEWSSSGLFRLYFLLNAVFFKSWSLFSSLSLQYSHTEEKQNLICQDATKDKEKKRHCIFTSRRFGATRLFTGSPHSLHTRVHHGSVFS